jgi:hypothetical protein
VVPPRSGAAFRAPVNTVAMAKESMTSLPDKRNEPVPDSLRIGVVARQGSSQGLFLDHDPHHERPDGHAGQHNHGVRFQSQRHADQQGDSTRVHRMAHHAVDAALDHRVLSVCLMLHDRRREGILPL